MKHTRIIAIEGIDGSGKSVQYARMIELLKARGCTVDAREYPRYDRFFGAMTGRYLSGTGGVAADTVDARSMALWYALDRWEDLKDFHDGDTDYMVINRYVLSNAVYQCVRDRDKEDISDWVFELEYEHFNLPRADLFLFYDVAPVQARRNVSKKGFREYIGEGADVYEASGGIQQRARNKYLECAAKRSDIAVIECMQSGEFLSVERISELSVNVLREKGLI